MSVVNKYETCGCRHNNTTTENIIHWSYPIFAPTKNAKRRRGKMQDVLA